MNVATLAMREAFRREVLPRRALWWLAADGMTGWYVMLRKGLRDKLGPATEPTLARIAKVAFDRRMDVLRTKHLLPADTALVMGGLTRTWANPKSRFVFAAVGAPPVTLADRVRAEHALFSLGADDRWREVATHLGEVLIALTEELPKVLPGANAALGKLCFAGGVAYATKVKRELGLPDTPESAIEVLRMGEYIFRVNPEHWHDADAGKKTGYLEGTACPWYARPGWGGQHCGIFGQFQSGISSVFGLRYHLTETIPKHGGTTCRIDLKPIPLRTSRDAA